MARLHRAGSGDATAVAHGVESGGGSHVIAVGKRGDGSRVFEPSSTSNESRGARGRKPLHTRNRDYVVAVLLKKL